MKFYKKAFVAFVGILSIGILASCGSKDDGYDVEAAAKRVILIEDKSEAVTGDFVVPKTVVLNDVTYKVDWVSNSEYAKVTPNSDETKYTIDIDYINNQASEQSVKLTATIYVEGSDKKVEKEFNFKIPKFVVNTIEYADSADTLSGTNLTLKGTIVTKEAYNTTNKNTNVYLMCDEGGFEAYRLSCTEEQYNTELVQGNSIYVSGPKAYYNGLREISPSTYVLASDAKKTITVEDITDLVTSGTGISTKYQGHYVKLTDLEIVKIDTASDGQISYYVGDPLDTSKQTIVRVSKYFAASGSALYKEYTDLNLVVGQKITATGFLGWYNGAQLTLFESGALVAGEVDYAKSLSLSYANAAKTAIGSQVVPLKTVILPSRLKDIDVTGENYEGYEIEWSTESEYATISTKDIAAKEAQADTEAEDAYVQYSITTSQPEEDTDVTLTLSLKDSEGEVLITQDVTFKLLAKVDYNTHDEYVAAAKDDALYLKGVISFISSDSKTIYLQDEDGGYYLYFSKAQTGDWVKVGTEIGVFGNKTTYNGMLELTNTVYIETTSDTLKEVDIEDYTEYFAENGYVELEDSLQCKPITFAGVVKSFASKTYVVTVGEKDINVYFNYNTQLFNPNDKIIVTGLLGIYSPANATAPTYQVIVVNSIGLVDNQTDEEKAASAIAAIKSQFSSDTYKSQTTIALNLKYENQEIILTSTDGNGVTLDDTENKIIITPTDTELTYELTFKVKVGEFTSEEQNITIVSQLPADGSITVIAKYEGDTTNFDKSDATLTNAELIGLDKTLFTATSIKNDASNHVGLNKDGTIRLYNKVNSTNGEALKIEIADGYTIKSIKYVIPSNSPSNAYVVTTGSTTLTAVDGVYEVNGTEVTIQNIDEPNNQLYISSIEITYVLNAD